MNQPILLISASLLAAACVEAPAGSPTDAAPAPVAIVDLPPSGTAHVWTPHGVLPVAYERHGDRVVFQGDMMVPVASFQRAMVDAAELEDILAGNADTLRSAHRALGRYRWPGGVIRWHQGPSITAVQRTRFLDAIAHWEANTGYSFVEISTKSGDYIEVIPGDGNGVCRSDVGRQGGEQELEVESCEWPGLVHELGHAVGLFHEHTRFDRDNFVDIHWENIKAGRENDFARYIDHPDMRDGTDAGPYDLQSTMHYGEFNASIDPPGTPNRRRTMTAREMGVVITPSTGLSAGDVRAVERMRSPGGGFSDDGSYVHLWSGHSFTGDDAGFLPGTYQASRNQLGDVGDDAASSMYVAPGMGARIFTGHLLGPSAWIDSGSHAHLPSGFDNAVSMIAVYRAVSVYRDANQGGAAQSLLIGNWSGSQIATVGDDAISSLFVPSGMIAELCLTASGSGCAPQFGGAINLSSNLDNQVSLVRVKAAVTIFSAPDMGGARKTLPIGTWTSAHFTPIGNNAISSLVVGEGLKATLCDTSTGGGTCEVFRGDVTYVGGTIDNKTSWIKVEPNTTP